MAHEHHALAVQSQARLRNAFVRLLVPLPTLWGEHKKLVALARGVVPTAHSAGSILPPCVARDAKLLQTLNHILRQISLLYWLSVVQAIVAAIPILARRQTTAAVTS
eukprot:6093415-Pleurochrysis_carterae.AAC.1